MVLLRLEIVNDYWIIERNPDYSSNIINNEYVYKRKGYWDAYNLLKASPVIYWEQPLSFEQFANNIWANGFVVLLDAPTGIGPKQRAEFVFTPPYIPENCVVSCRIAYNGTGLLFRFPDLVKPNALRQIRITGATYDHPGGSVVFSILHSHPLREDIYTWNWSSCVYSSSPSSIPYRSLSSISSNSLIRSTSSLFSKFNSDIFNFDFRKNGKKISYDLDFRLDSKYTTQIYPLIIHPLNRFFNLDSYYMAELSEICMQSQGFSDIKNSLQMAEKCYNKVYRLFKTYPFLIQLCMWLKTPSKLKQQKLHRRNMKVSRRLKQNSLYYQDSGYTIDNQQDRSMSYYPMNRSYSHMRFNSSNDPNQFSYNNNNEYNPRRDSFANPLRMNSQASLGQHPFYGFNRESMYDDMNDGNLSSDQLNSMYFERCLCLNNEDYYEYQNKRQEIFKMKFIIEKLAALIQYLQYSSPFLLTTLLLYIYKKKAREWFVLFKCAYQLITFQLKDPYVIVTSPKKKRTNY
ncbi:hypothetical protein BCR32DRAFT_269710 [Anaeromyces robustus]|uniref:Uncharacterized protein n=1 Tax=Anaeromyces robustus TaxID=1754192 RepID=A0A1Y1WZY8_9FUNG|nr:hypothetical protein BCR32DRAFT_269710 [Anaeromyces robustus]|eukprot:ORX79043.1 hypothetical protein BCR32DRAFT_269710 [Anaeromyces robustus]